MELARTAIRSSAAATAGICGIALVVSAGVCWGDSANSERIRRVESEAVPAAAAGGDSARRSGEASFPAPAEVRRRSELRSRRAHPGQQGADDRERVEYKPAVLQIVTNFKKADAAVNGIPYPEYVGPGEEPGMVLPAGGPYDVKVTYNGKTKNYTLSLDPYEVRYLMVELSGFKGGAPTGTANSTPDDSANAEPEQQNNDNNDGNVGRVTVYSKPKGDVLVDGSKKGQKTPGTIKVPPGEHDIQVEFENGKNSETKTVRVRKGSRIKLFFRKNN